MRITLVGALAIAGVVLAVFLIVSLKRQAASQPTDRPANPPQGNLPPLIPGQSGQHLGF